jgi:hypothetical protein
MHEWESPESCGNLVIIDPPPAFYWNLSVSFKARPEYKAKKAGDKEQKWCTVGIEDEDFEIKPGNAKQGLDMTRRSSLPVSSTA